MAGRLPSRERRQLLPDPVFHNAEIRGLQAVDVLSLVIRDREAEHHQIHLRLENRRALRCPAQTARFPLRPLTAPECSATIRHFSAAFCLRPLVLSPHFSATCTLSHSHFFAHRPDAPQQRRPIFQMRGENSFHHSLRPLRHQHVQLRRLHAYLVAPRRPSRAGSTPSSPP